MKEKEREHTAMGYFSTLKKLQHNGQQKQTSINMFIYIPTMMC